MAWLREAFKLLEKLVESINNPKSKLWSKCSIAMLKIESECKISAFLELTTDGVNQIMLQQKELWITNEKSVKQILKHLIFHSNQILLSDWIDCIYSLQTFTEREQWIAIIRRGHSNCCRAFGQFASKYCPMIPELGFDIVFVVEFDPSYGEDWESAFWHALFWLNQSTYDINDKSYMQTLYGFLFVFGAKYIKKLLLNKSEKELQKQLATMWKLCGSPNIDTIKLSKMLISWRSHTDIEQYGKMFIPHQFEPNTFTGDIVFLYAKMHLKNKRYLDAKYEFVCAIYYALSFVIISLSLQYLSKLCLYFGEYGVGFNVPL